VINSFSKIKSKIPGPVRSFFTKALILFIIWKAAYLLFLLPHRTLDEPLTRWVGMSTTRLLNVFSHGDPFSVQEADSRVELEGGAVIGHAMDIYLYDKKTLRVEDVCNGLELLVLYAGFIVAFPARARRKWGFIASGFLLIFLLNILRCALLVEIYLHYNAYLDFSHHFVFTFIVYGFIFLLWYLFTKNQRLHGSLA
jgi:exosortase family protein XrtF